MQQINRAAPASGVLKHSDSIPPSRLKSCVKNHAAASPGASCPARRAISCCGFKKWRLRSDSNRRDTASGAANRATYGCIWPLCHGDDNNFQLMYFSRDLATSQSRNLKKKFPAHVTRGKRRKTETSEKNKSLYIAEKRLKRFIFYPFSIVMFLLIRTCKVHSLITLFLF